jgi:hypothetical protein
MVFHPSDHFKDNLVWLNALVRPWKPTRLVPARFIVYFISQSRWRRLNVVATICSERTIGNWYFPWDTPRIDFTSIALFCLMAAGWRRGGGPWVRGWITCQSSSSFCIADFLSLEQWQARSIWKMSISNTGSCCVLVLWCPLEYLWIPMLSSFVY